MVDRNQSDLLGIIATGLADNTSGAITAEVLRDIMSDTVDTIFTVTSASGATTTAIGAADGETSIVLGNGSGIHFAAGTNVTATLSDAGNGSGVVAIGLGPLGSFGENPSGLMSSFKFGSVDANGQGQRLTIHDSSGIMLKAGSNMSIDFGGYATADSGVFTFNAVLPSGNAITSVSIAGDTGYTWSGQTAASGAIVAGGAADTLTLVAGTGIHMRTDSSNNAILIANSGHPPTSSAIGFGDLVLYDASKELYRSWTGLRAVGANGNLLVGHPTTVQLGMNTGRGVSVFGDTSNGLGNSPSILVHSQSSSPTTLGGFIDLSQGRGQIDTSMEGPSSASGDVCGTVIYSCTDSANFNAAFVSAVQGRVVNPETGKVTGKLEFHTAAGQGSTAPTDRTRAMVLDELGNLDVSGVVRANGISAQASGLRIGGAAVTSSAAELNLLDGVTALGSGTMSKFHVGINGSSLPITDGSGLFFAGGSNISVDMSNNNGSGILTFNLISDPASSGNAFGVISTSSDVGYTWNTASNVTAIADGQALNIIPASGVRIDTDNTNSAIRIGVSGTLPDLESAPNLSTIGTITTGTWNADTITVSKGGTGSTSFGAGEVIFMPDVGTALSSSSRMKFDGQTFTITHTAGPGITLENTNADENGGLFKFNKDGSSPATNDAIGTIEWSSEDSGGNGTTYAKLVGTIADVDAASEQGAIKFFVAELDGTLTEGMRIEGANSDGDVTVDIATHDGANGGLKLGGTLVTSTAAELNALDGFTGSSIGSGTMSRFKIGAETSTLNIFDGSGVYFAAGDNMTVSMSDAGSGSGVITFASSASGGSGSGTMSKFRVGASTMPSGTAIEVGDGGALLFAAGDSMAVTLTETDAGSGILTFAPAVTTNNPTFTGNITIGSAEISETELEILDGATVTTTELNLLDGGVGLNDLNDTAVSGSISSSDGLLMVFDNAGSGLYIGDNTHNNLQRGDDYFSAGNTDSYNNRVALGGNTHIGWCAGSGSKTGYHNTLVGTRAGHKLGTYQYANTFIGFNAGSGLKNGSVFTSLASNIILGYNAATAPSFIGNWYSNVIIGNDTITKSGQSVNHNVAIGENVLQNVNTSYKIVSIGYDAFYNADTINDSVVIGYQAGYNATIVDDEVLIGHQAGYGVASGDGNVMIGYQTAYYQDRNDTVAIGSSAGGGKSGAGYVDGGVYLGHMAGYSTSIARDHNELYIANNQISAEGTLIKGDFGHKLVAIGAADEDLTSASGTLQLYVKHPTTKGLYVKGAFGQTAPLAEFYNHNSEKAVEINSFGVLHASGISAGPSGLRINGTAVTASATELNALDGFTGSSIGSGTMSKLHVGSTTQVDPNQISLGDGSGLFFAAGDNMTITTTNTDGSGVITFASSASGGDSGSGTMSKFHVGATTMPEGTKESITDGSGLFFAAGDNMTITLTNDINGSGVLTFASSASGGGTATSGNAFANVSIAGDTGYTWAGQTAASGSVTAGGDADTLTLVAGTGIHMRADSNNNALLIAASGFPPTSSATGFGDVVLYDTSKEMYKSWTGLRAVGANNNLLAGHPTTVQLGIDTGRGVNIFGDVSNSLTNSPSILVHSQASSPTSLGGFIDLSQGRGQIDTSMEGPSSASGDACGTVIYSCTDSANATAAFVSAVQGRVINPEAGKVSGKLEFHTARGMGDTQPTDKTRAMVLNELGNLDVSGVVRANGISAQASGLRIGGVAVTSDAAELNILDGVTATSTELNIMDAGATVTTPTVAGGDAFVMNDADVGMRQVDIDNVDTYLAATTKTLTNKTLTSPTITSPTITGEFAIGRLVNPGKEKLQVAGEIATSGIRISGRRTVSGASAPGTPSGVFTVENHQGLEVLQINSVGVLYASGVSAGPSGLRIDGVAVTSSATELNYVDGVTSAIQTQLDTKGSGTMSKFHVGVNGSSDAVTDGSGLMFVAGDNVTVSLEGNNGSGILTFASAVSTNNPTFTGNITIGDAEISETELEILDGATLTTTELNYVDGVTSAIQTQLDAKASLAGASFTGEVSIGRLVNPGKEKLQVAGEIATSGITISGRRTVSGASAPGTPSGVFTVQNHEGLDVVQINSVGVIYGSGISAGPSGLRINGTAITATPAELNLIDGGATVGTTAVADGDGIIHNDDGTMRVTTVQTFDTYFAQTTKTLTNKTLTSPTITSPTITGTTALASGVTIGRPAGDAADGYSLEVAGQIGASGVVVPPITASDGATITFDLKRSSFHMVTLGGNRTLAVEDAKVGQKFMVRLQQDGAGSRTVTFFNGIRWAGGGTAPTLTTTPNQADLFGFVATSGTTDFDGFIIGQNI